MSRKGGDRAMVKLPASTPAGHQFGRTGAQSATAAAAARRGARGPSPGRATDAFAGGQLPALCSPVAGRSACQPMKSTNACKG